MGTVGDGDKFDGDRGDGDKYPSPCSCLTSTRLWVEQRSSCCDKHLSSLSCCENILTRQAFVLNRSFSEPVEIFEYMRDVRGFMGFNSNTRKRV